MPNADDGVDNAQPIGGTIYRRELMRRGAATGAALATLGAGGMRIAPRFSPVGRARAGVPLAIAAVGVVAGVAILAGGLSNDEEDTSTEDINEAEAAELHARVAADFAEMEADRNMQITSMQDNIEMASDYIRSNVAFVIAERTKAGDTKQEVIDAAKAEVGDTMVGIEQNLFNYYETDMLKIGRRADLVENQDGLARNDVFRWVNQSNGEVDYDPYEEYLAAYDSGAEPFEYQWIHLANDAGPNTVDYTQVDGSTVTKPSAYQYTAQHNASSNKHQVLYIVPHHEEPEAAAYQQILDGYQAADDEEWWWYECRAVDPDTGDRYTVQNGLDYMEVHEELVQVYNDELTNAETLVDTLYQPIKDGEVDAHDIASGAAVMDASVDLEHYGQAAGYYRAVNMPEAEEPTRVNVDGNVLEGILFWTTPDPDGLPVGETIDPEQRLGELHMAAEVMEVAEEPADVDVTIEVVDDSGAAVEGADVAIDGETATTDVDGLATFSAITEGTYDVTVTTDDGTETLTSIGVSESDTQHTVTHDGTDTTTDESLVHLAEHDVGEVTTLQLAQPFEIEGIHGGGETLYFEERELTQPDDDPQEVIERLQELYESEQEAREERQEIIIEMAEEDDDGIGFPNFGWGGDGGLLGVGIIVAAVAFVAGIVTRGN